MNKDSERRPPQPTRALKQFAILVGEWTPDFSQRMTGTFSADGNTITWHGELSRDGSTWEPDLSVAYTRKQ